jgi:hypothetical protein
MMEGILMKDGEKKSWFRKLLGVAHTSGTFYRETILTTVEETRERIVQIQERAHAARDFVRSRTPEGSELRSNWRALQEALKAGVSDAISGLQGIASVSREAINGLDERLALVLFDLHRLEREATAKAALELPELRNAKAMFDQLRMAIQADANAEFKDELEALSRAFSAAREAIKRVPYNASDLRRQFIALTATFEDLDNLAGDYTTSATAYAERFGEVSGDLAIGAETVEAIKTRFNELKTMVDSGTPMVAAVPLSVVRHDIEQLRVRISGANNHLDGQTQKLQSLEGFMNTQVGDAERSGCQNDPELLSAARNFIKVTRRQPINLEEAETYKDAYVERLEHLQEQA